MKQSVFRHHQRELGIAWFLVPLLAACVALLGLIAIVPPSSLDDPLRAASLAAGPPAYVSSDPSVPAASSVFTDGPSYVPGLAVETF